MASRLKTHQLRFLQFLFDLSKKADRGTLAVLRRGLSSPPGEDLNMVRYVAGFVPDYERGTSAEKIYYLIAGLYAYHQNNCNNGNFGDHMHNSISESSSEATERRFTILLNAHSDDMPDYLRQSVSYLKSKEVAINWQQLFEDLLRWNHPARFVQKSWANSFWGYQDETDND